MTSAVQSSRRPVGRGLLLVLAVLAGLLAMHGLAAGPDVAARERAVKTFGYGDPYELAR